MHCRAAVEFCKAAYQMGARSKFFSKYVASKHGDKHEERGIHSVGKRLYSQAFPHSTVMDPYEIPFPMASLTDDNAIVWENVPVTCPWDVAVCFRKAGLAERAFSVSGDGGWRLWNHDYWLDAVEFGRVAPGHPISDLRPEDWGDVTPSFGLQTMCKATKGQVRMWHSRHTLGVLHRMIVLYIKNEIHRDPEILSHQQRCQQRCAVWG